MHYIGSKKKLSGFIVETVQEVCGNDLSDKVFCDIFAGTGIVGRTFNGLCKKIISNDLEYYSYVLNKGYLNHSNTEKDAEVISFLNNIAPAAGKLHKNYHQQGRTYFTEDNFKKIDAVRCEIEKHKDDPEYYYLLTCLLEAADEVSNVASVYGAFLKSFKGYSLNPLTLKNLQADGREENEVYNLPANDLIPEIQGDILYLDPPYNGREYGANYHMLNSIAKYDDFVPKGKTGLREYTKSEYCKKKQVYAALDDLIKNANFNHVFMSYNNEGLLSTEDIETIFSKYGTYSVFTKEYKRFVSQRGQGQSFTIEYLHVLNKK